MISANKPITSEQITRMHTLLSKLNMKDDKVNIMSFYANRPVSSSKDLSYDEAYTIIDYLVSVQRMNPDEIKCDKMRKKVISACREIGWNVGGKADMKHVNDWCIQYGHMHKPLNEYTVKELPQLVTQAEHLRKDVLSKL